MQLQLTIAIYIYSIRTVRVAEDPYGPFNTGPRILVIGSRGRQRQAICIDPNTCGRSIRVGNDPTRIDCTYPMASRERAF